MEPALLRQLRRRLVRGLPLLHEALQLQFFRGSSLEPDPPKAGTHPEVRYLDIYEDDDVDEALLASWFEQASALPGEHV